MTPKKSIRYTAWRSIDPRVREIAERTCTPKQLDALKLRAEGLGYKTVARVLNLDVSSTRDRIQRAERRLLKALEDEDWATHDLRIYHLRP
jgi:DNA-directed RNA polymerase specialized sigma24 family protein